MKNIHLNCSLIKLSYIKKMSATFKNISLKKASFIFYLLEKNYKIRPKWHISLCESLILFVPNSYRIFFIFVVIYNLCLFASTFTSQNYNSQNYARCCCYYRLFILETIKIAHFLYVKKSPSINDYWSIVWLFLHTPVI